VADEPQIHRRQAMRPCIEDSAVIVLGQVQSSGLVKDVRRHKCEVAVNRLNGDGPIERSQDIWAQQAQRILRAPGSGRCLGLGQELTHLVDRSLIGCGHPDPFTDGHLSFHGCHPITACTDRHATAMPTAMPTGRQGGQDATTSYKRPPRRRHSPDCHTGYWPEPCFART